MRPSLLQQLSLPFYALPYVLLRYISRILSSFYPYKLGLAANTFRVIIKANGTRKTKIDLEALKKYPVDAPYDGMPETAIHNPILAEGIAHATKAYVEVALKAQEVGLMNDARAFNKRANVLAHGVERHYYSDQGTTRKLVKAAQESQDFSRVDPELIEQAASEREVLKEQAAAARRVIEAARQEKYEERMENRDQKLIDLRTAALTLGYVEKAHEKFIAYDTTTLRRKLFLVAAPVLLDQYLDSSRALIHYDLQSTKYDMIITLNSLRLAADGYKRLLPDAKDAPKFTDAITVAVLEEGIRLNDQLGELVAEGLPQNIVNEVLNSNTLLYTNAVGAVSLIKQYASSKTDSNYTFREFLSQHIHQAPIDDGLWQVAESRRLATNRAFQETIERRRRKKAEDEEEERLNAAGLDAAKNLKKVQQLRALNPETTELVDSIVYGEEFVLRDQGALTLLVELLATRLATEQNKDIPTDVGITGLLSLKELEDKGILKQPKNFYGGQKELHVTVDEIGFAFTTKKDVVINPRNLQALTITLAMHCYKGLKTPKLEYISTVETCLYPLTSYDGMLFAVTDSDLDANTERIAAEHRISIQNARGLEAAGKLSALQGGRVDGNRAPRR